MAPSKRRKADKLPLPQTTAEAVKLLQRYAAIDAILAARRADMDVIIADLRAEHDLVCAEIEPEIKAIFNQLKPWWAVASAELTEGKRKSIELGGCMIGDRISNPSVKYAKDTEGTIIAMLQEAGLRDLVRVKTELDKPAIIKAAAVGRDVEAEAKELAGSDQLPELEMINTVRWNLSRAGVSIVQKEEFFIDRIAPKEPAVEVMPDAPQPAIRVHVHAPKPMKPETVAAIEAMGASVGKAVRS